MVKDKALQECLAKWLKALSELKARYSRECDVQSKQADEELIPLHKDLWDTIYAELKLDPDGEYNIDHETGEITEAEEDLFTALLGTLTRRTPTIHIKPGPRDN
jgi:hypothetical protein